MLFMVCKDHCLSYGKCNELHLRKCPKFTLQTIYVCKYLSLQSLFSPRIYPYAGTWLDQPLWFMHAFTTGMNKLNEIQQAKYKK